MGRGCESNRVGTIHGREGVRAHGARTGSIRPCISRPDPGSRLDSARLVSNFASLIFTNRLYFRTRLLDSVRFEYSTRLGSTRMLRTARLEYSTLLELGTRLGSTRFGALGMVFHDS